MTILRLVGSWQSVTQRIAISTMLHGYTEFNIHSTFQVFESKLNSRRKIKCLMCGNYFAIIRFTQSRGQMESLKIGLQIQRIWQISHDSSLFTPTIGCRVAYNSKLTYFDQANQLSNVAIPNRWYFWLTLSVGRRMPCLNEGEPVAVDSIKDIACFNCICQVIYRGKILIIVVKCISRFLFRLEY